MTIFNLQILTYKKYAFKAIVKIINRILSAGPERKIFILYL